MFNENDVLAATTLRMLAIDAVQAANSGHPGLPLGAADMALVLWTRHMKHDPNQPEWPNRDRFVLSAGHGSALLYALLHLSGYPLPMDEVKNFRQWGSLTAGHPEYDPAIGIETTTGPLGQGFANAVGLALAERMLAGENVISLSRQHNLSRNMMYRWRNAYRERGAAGLQALVG